MSEDNQVISDQFESEPTYKVNDEIQFGVIERFRDYGFFPVATYYTYKEMTGKVINIRDTSIDKLNYATVSKKPEIERSKYLITIKTKEGIKKYYHGRIVNVKPIQDAKQIVLNKISESINQTMSTLIDISEQISNLQENQLNTETEEVTIKL